MDPVKYSFVLNNEKNYILKMLQAGGSSKNNDMFAIEVINFAIEMSKVRIIVIKSLVDNRRSASACLYESCYFWGIDTVASESEDQRELYIPHRDDHGAPETHGSRCQTLELDEMFECSVRTNGCRRRSDERYCGYTTYELFQKIAISYEQNFPRNHR